MGMNLLPLEILSIIISHTSPRDACRLSLVSVPFKAAADSDSVWDTFLPSDFPPIISQSILSILSLNCPSASAASSSSSSLGFSSEKELYFHFCCRPILVDNGKLSFALEKNTGKRCYMVGARGLSIIWSDTPPYWSWTPDPKSRFSEVAKLNIVCWLDIKGKVETSLLSPKTSYTAYFVFQFEGSVHGFKERAVELRVYLEGQGQDSAEGHMVYLDPPENKPQLCTEREDGWMDGV